MVVSQLINKLRLKASKAKTRFLAKLKKNQ